MTEPTKPTTAPTVPEGTEEYHWTYRILFQAWLVLFLGVICFALMIYLISYIPK